MDVFEQVREVHAGVSLTEERISGARVRLLDGIDADRGRKRRRLARRSLVIVGALAGAAAATVAVVVLDHPTTPPPRVEAVPPVATKEPIAPEPTAPAPMTASSVLSAAARASGANTAPAPQQGQYLKIEREVNDLVLYGTTNPSSMFDASRADATAAWIAQGHWTIYVPADRSAEWVQEFANQSQLTAFYGVDAEAHAQEWLGGDRQPFYNRTPGGLGESGPGELSRASDAYYAAFPRDPQALLEWIRVKNGATDGSEWSNGTVTEVLLEELQYNTAPADLRASMYQVLALLPNGTIAAVDGDITTISFASNAGRWVTNGISIDMSTGLVVGSAIRQDAGAGIVPEDVPDSWMTITVSVVDSAP
ncbi:MULTISPECIES: hypothetical protein [unclassified Microbacterium]|uniref:hypothetical protein n=1 Tax=unclassified Microbacterium TaxID=2609290 RepID=UPI00109CB7B1|nr:MULTISPECIES: hypothetical protein [unclassified Microbacterium]